jgi:hypothetical protein
MNWKDDDVDVGSEPQREHEWMRRRSAAPQQDILLQENNLSGELRYAAVGYVSIVKKKEGAGKVTFKVARLLTPAALGAGTGRH